jgi:Golgi apparatus protein 1
MISEPECKALVHEYRKLAAQDIRFDVPLADACINDRTKFCAHVPPVRCQV